MVQKNKKGLLPTIKEFFTGSQSLNHWDYNHEQNGGTIFSYFFSNAQYDFKQYDSRTLLRLYFKENPIGFSVVSKIINAFEELKVVPYKDGESIKKEMPLDIGKAFFQLVTTGTCLIKKIKPIGYNDYVYKVLYTQFITHQKTKSGYKYFYHGLNIESEGIISIKIMDDPDDPDCLIGVNPFNAINKPMETTSNMYTADASLLKNKGSDVMITNDSDEPIMGMESEELTKELNKRISGARKMGQISATTAKLRAIQLGRTTKELALWDGYKYKLRDICNAFDLDSSHFNDPENKRFSNLTEAKESLYSNCVIPRLRKITENKELIKSLGFELFIDDSNIDALQNKQKIKAEKNKMIQDCIISLNDSIKSESITKEIALNILVSEWGYDEAEAKLNINGY